MFCMTGRVADLHMHTTASDGTDSLEKRVYDARDRDLTAIAVTDHDTISEELSERSTEMEGVEVITGAEIKASLNGRKVEILGYFLDPSDEELVDLLDDIKERRVERMEGMVEKLNDLVEPEITLDNVLSRTDSTVGRPHLAEEMVYQGVVDEFQDAFKEYLGEDGLAYVESDLVDVAEVIEAVHANGGVASLAHPGLSLDDESAEDDVAYLVDAGLDAIETYYDYGDIDEKPWISFGNERTWELVEQHDLLTTGGSDCHGSQAGEKYRIGTVVVPYGDVDLLRERSREYREEGE